MEAVLQYRTIQGPVTAEFKDRGSRFLAFGYPVANANEVKAYIQELKKEHPKANHHCYAYRIGIDGTQYRAVDDGEPSGSAGKPILGQIDSIGFTNVLVVVVRYFGGTLLGVPGLINAYKTVTADALFTAKPIEKLVEDVHDITFDYSVMGEILYILRQCEATIYEQDLQLFCRIRAGIPRKNVDAYVPRLSEIRGVEVKPAQ